MRHLRPINVAGWGGVALNPGGGGVVVLRFSSVPESLIAGIPLPDNHTSSCDLHYCPIRGRGKPSASAEAFRRPERPVPEGALYNFTRHSSSSWRAPY